MCDRTQEEILARMFAYFYHLGLKEGVKQACPPLIESSSKYAEENYQRFMKEAREELQTINNHEKEDNGNENTV